MTTSPDSESLLPETAETIRHQVRVEFRIYLVMVTVISLIVGGVMGKFLFHDTGAALRMETINVTPLIKQDTTPLPTINIESRTLSVYVSGAVNAAKVVTLPQGSLVLDALEAAGGASPEADLDAINLATPLRDHDHILVPGYAKQGSAQSTTVLMNINTATTTELEELPNIGPARAQQIVAYRESHGPFQSVEDIMLVSGIGPAIFEELAPFIYVDVE
jgi:competence protein ComEA